MKKKLVGILVCMLLIITIIPTVSSDNKIDNKSKNNIEINVYENNFDDILSRYTVMQEPIDLTKSVTTSEKPIPKATPDEFSWRDYNGKDWTTPAKNQKNCGSCWAFAPLGVYESMIKIRENCAEFNPDLSEQYLLSCINGAGSCRGGNSNEALQLLDATTPQGNFADGIIFESCLEYQADDDIPCSDKCENWEEQLVPIFDYGMWEVSGTKEDIESIKTHIMETGPVVSYIRVKDMFQIWGSLNHDPDDFYYHLFPVVMCNHVIMIVGWKDVALIPTGGYWICKNSWGQGFGYDGFFNIAYGSLNIDKIMITWADYDPDSFDWAPIPDTGGPYGVYLGEELTFDASESIGVEGEITEYSWDFGDEVSGNGVTTTHTYTSLGKYTAILNITDSENNKGSTSTSVWVQESNQPSNIPTIYGPLSGHVNLNYEYTFQSTDPEENDIWYIVDWGDGEIEELGPFSSGEETSIYHYWEKKGSYTIKVKTKDVFDDESDWETLDITMPKDKAKDDIRLINFLSRILDNFPLLAKLLQNTVKVLFY